MVNIQNKTWVLVAIINTVKPMKEKAHMSHLHAKPANPCPNRLLIYSSLRSPLWAPCVGSISNKFKSLPLVRSHMASLVGVTKVAAKTLKPSPVSSHRQANIAKIAAPFPCDYLLSPLISGVKPGL